MVGVKWKYEGKKKPKNGGGELVFLTMFFFEVLVGEAEGVVGIDAVATAPVDKIEKLLSEFLLRDEG